MMILKRLRIILSGYIRD